MRLHLLGIPHTVTRPDFSHCAFTGKVLRFARMMRPFGYEVIHYGVEGAESGATEDVVLLSTEEHVALLGHPYRHDQQYKADAREGSPVYRQFNLNAREELRARVAPGDVVLLPFGHAHAAAIRGLDVLTRGAGAIESGIGYVDCLLPWRVYESFAGLHRVMAREGRDGVSIESTRLEFVAPNYYDVTEWDFVPTGTTGPTTFLFAGRIEEGKGVRIVLDLARARPGARFLLAGQGDVDALGALPPNVSYLGVVTGRARSALYGSVDALLAPSRYVEPFAGVVVEAALCGTPAITSHFGAFAETVEQGETGIRAQTFEDFVRALDLVPFLDRALVRRRAASLYSLSRVGQTYRRIFETVAERLAAEPYPTHGWNP